MNLKKKIVKSISWRLHASISTIIVSYIFTGEWRVAGAIAITLTIIKLLLYLYHEKLWEDWLDDYIDLIE